MWFSGCVREDELEKVWSPTPTPAGVWCGHDESYSHTFRRDFLVRLASFMGSVSSHIDRHLFSVCAVSKFSSVLTDDHAPWYVLPEEVR